MNNVSDWIKPVTVPADTHRHPSRVKNELTLKFSERDSACLGSDTAHNSAVNVCVDEELQSEEELDKELLWNLQLLSEVRRRSVMSPGIWALEEVSHLAKMFYRIHLLF